jgi:hypothetical protein
MKDRFVSLQDVGTVLHVRWTRSDRRSVYYLEDTSMTYNSGWLRFTLKRLRTSNLRSTLLVKGVIVYMLNLSHVSID